MKSYQFVKNHLVVAACSAVAVFIALESLVTNAGVNGTAKVILAALIVFAVVLVLGVYLTFKDRRALRHRLDDISAFITVLSNGKLSDRINIADADELAAIERALNRLADRFEKQVAFLQKLADEKAELAEQAKNAATIEERQRLARDLHDAVSQQLFALNMLASAAKKAIEKNQEVAKRQIDEIADIALKAQGEMRALLLHLRPVHLSDDTLQEGLEKLIDELSQKTNIRFETTIEAIDGLSKGVEDHLFRLAQEGLSNALRHSKATVIKLQLTDAHQTVLLRVQDNGKGFNVTDDKKISYGLKTMRERCEQLGGKLTITSREGEGTFVDVRIPLQIGGNRGGKTD